MEPREDLQSTGPSESSDRPTWANKLKTPQMTTAFKCPTPTYQELWAQLAEVSRLTTLLLYPPPQHPSPDPPVYPGATQHLSCISFT
ncbi:hypothetical protein HPB50_013400 [Hyalomma asiaticum]|uniref:Uncharacterized protein n=1 Tax=Hyalomma asiaticum TaxID=266040 RepID=A0ACB7RJ02_HYAAI|nr:hypothetical protein HPB50_013400 [Hyalomma asiaticum]